MGYLVLGLLCPFVGLANSFAAMLYHETFGAYTFHISFGVLVFWHFVGVLCINRVR